MHISVWNVALQVINFAILAWLLQRFLFKPVRAILAKRQEAIETAMREADEKKKEAERVIEEYRAKALDIPREAERAREAALALAEKEAVKLRDDATRQAKAEIERGKGEVERERVEALHVLEHRASELATTIARRLLNETMPESDVTFLWRVLASIDAVEPARKGATLRQLTAGVEVVSSHPLDAIARARFEGWLLSFAGKPIAVTYGVDDSLIAGVEMRSPTGVWRSHWRESLEQIRAELEAHATAA